jgi:hypothetical protein
MLERVAITGRRAAAGGPAVHPTPSPALHCRGPAWVPAPGPGTAARALVHARLLPRQIVPSTWLAA